MIKAFVLALFIQSILPVIVLGIMFYRRTRAIRTGSVPLKYFKSHQGVDGDSPEDLRVVERHFSNLFETPVLFFVVSLLYLFLDYVDQMAVLLTWAFVLLRVVHAYIHLGRNHVGHRFTVFFLSIIVFLIQWIYLLGKFFLAL